MFIPAHIVDLSQHVAFKGQHAVLVGGGHGLDQGRREALIGRETTRQERNSKASNHQLGFLIFYVALSFFHLPFYLFILVNFKSSPFLRLLRANTRAQVTITLTPSNSPFLEINLSRRDLPNKT